MPFDAPAIADVVEAVIRSALAPIVERVKALEGLFTKDVSRVEGYTAFLQRDLAAAMERIATLEARPPVEGPPGPPGQDGIKGADGVSFADFEITYDGERTFTHSWRLGEKTIAVPFKMPTAIYQGVFVDGKIYERGDMVTVNGSIYHCDQDTTSRPGDGSKDWTLAVKRGKDDRGAWPR